MVAVELGMEMYVAGYDSAMFWDNGGGDGGHDDQMLLSTREGPWRFNPMHIGFELLAQGPVICDVHSWLGKGKVL